MTDAITLKSALGNVADDIVNEIWEEALAHYKSRLFTDDPERGYRRWPQYLAFSERLGWETKIQDRLILSTIADGLLFVFAAFVFLVNVSHIHWIASVLGSILLIAWVVTGLKWVTACGSVSTNTMRSFLPFASELRRFVHSRIKKHHFTPREKLLICGDYLLYNANIAHFEHKTGVSELQESIKRHNQRLINSEEIDEKDASIVREAKGIINQSFLVYHKEEADRLEELKNRVERQQALGKRLHTLAEAVSLLGVEMTDQTSSSGRRLLSLEKIEQSISEIDAMDAIMKKSHQEVVEL